MEISTIIILVILFTIGLAMYLDRSKIFKRYNSPENSNRSKYLVLIYSLSFLDEILDEKISLGKDGLNIDFGYLNQQFQIMELVSSGKLAIFGASFTKEIMDIVNDAEFDIVSVENASKYVKNEISKLQKLV